MAELQTNLNSIGPSGPDRNPAVSIGMPVYNGAKYIRDALDSLLAQTFADFELIISDNASTDETQKICEEYAQHYLSIKYFRQNSNIGAAANFEFVLNKAVGEYFMWAACDDIRSSDFLDLNIRFLRQNSEYLASTSPVKFREAEFSEITMGDASLDSDNRYERIVQLFRCWHANGRFYSLFRRSVLIDCQFSKLKFIGADWALITRLANIGKFKRIHSGCVQLGKDGVSNSTDIFTSHRATLKDLILPFNKLSVDTWEYMVGANILQKLRLLFFLLRLNLQAFVYQFYVMYKR